MARVRKEEMDDIQDWTNNIMQSNKSKKYEEDEILKKEITFTQMIRWLNKYFKEKITGKKFNAQDVEGYIRREQLPEHYGGHSIKLVKKIGHVKLYNIYKNV